MRTVDQFLLGGTHGTQYVATWAHAHYMVFEFMGLHTEDSFITYLRWFRPHTHVRVMLVVVDPQLCLRMMHAMFPHHHHKGFAGLVS
jgi:hypothetical protein